MTQVMMLFSICAAYPGFLLQPGRHRLYRDARVIPQQQAMEVPYTLLFMLKTF